MSKCCAVCLVVEGGTLTSCSRCGVVVHMECYCSAQNTPSPPPPPTFTCDICLAALKPQNTECVFCPVLGGAMKRVVQGGSVVGWGHVMCGDWLPCADLSLDKTSITVTNQKDLADRKALRCQECQQKNGACVQCFHKSCRASFHVTCARNAAYPFLISREQTTMTMQLYPFCPKHTEQRDRMKQNCKKTISFGDKTQQKSPQHNSKATPTKTNGNNHTNNNQTITTTTTSSSSTTQKTPSAKTPVAKSTNSKGSTTTEKSASAKSTSAKSTSAKSTTTPNSKNQKPRESVTHQQGDAESISSDSDHVTVSRTKASNGKTKNHNSNNSSSDPHAAVPESLKNFKFWKKPNEAICDVCLEPDSTKDNLIVFCDSCEVGVHQQCYGIQTIPAGGWFCLACEANAQNQSCGACLRTGGAMYPTRNNTGWVHALCMLCVPELYMEDEKSVSGFPTALKKRKCLSCSVCRSKKDKKEGLCIQCQEPSCTTAAHPKCALDQWSRCVQTEPNLMFHFRCRTHSARTGAQPAAKTTTPSHTPAKRKRQLESSGSSSAWSSDDDVIAVPGRAQVTSADLMPISSDNTDDEVAVVKKQPKASKPRKPTTGKSMAQPQQKQRPARGDNLNFPHPILDERPRVAHRCEVTVDDRHVTEALAEARPLHLCLKFPSCSCPGRTAAQFS